VPNSKIKNINGCDSVIMLNLSLYPAVNTTYINDTICLGEIYTENGFNANIAGIYCKILQNINNCDSVIVLFLTVKHVGECETGIENILENEILIYPNPVVNGQLIIENGQLQAGDMVQIFDINGKNIVNCQFNRCFHIARRYLFCENWQ
jgi:hypothetical protein